MNKPYQYFSEIDSITDGESTLTVMEYMPDWEGKDLVEDIDFEVDLHADNHKIGIAIPVIKSKIKTLTTT